MIGDVEERVAQFLRLCLRQECPTDVQVSFRALRFWNQRVGSFLDPVMEKGDAVVLPEEKARTDRFQEIPFDVFFGLSLNPRQSAKRVLLPRQASCVRLFFEPT